MMKTIRSMLVLTLGCLPACVLGQESDVDRGAAVTNAALNWIRDLNERGLEIRGDAVIVGKEVLKALQDESYRKVLYPETYTWQAALQLIQDRKLKIAFWHFVNLYPLSDTNRVLVARSVLAYDRLFKMDEVMVNAFYTYAFTDPEVSEFRDGIPEIVRPDLLEAKLRGVREIVGCVRRYRKLRAEGEVGGATVELRPAGATPASSGEEPRTLNIEP